MKRSRSIANKVYRYVHEVDVSVTTNLKGRRFSREWLTITEDGTIRVRAGRQEGYAWDGCSPKFHWIDLCWGTPDGRLDERTERPMTYYGSMIHDALYQYKRYVPVSRKEADLIFREILRQSGFIWWWLYGTAVRVGGGFYGSWRKKVSAKNVAVYETSWLSKTPEPERVDV